MLLFVLLFWIFWRVRDIFGVCSFFERGTGIGVCLVRVMGRGFVFSVMFYFYSILRSTYYFWFIIEEWGFGDISGFLGLVI